MIHFAHNFPILKLGTNQNSCQPINSYIDGKSVMLSMGIGGYKYRIAFIQEKMDVLPKKASCEQPTNWWSPRLATLLPNGIHPSKKQLWSLDSKSPDLKNDFFQMNDFQVPVRGFILAARNSHLPGQMETLNSTFLFLLWPRNSRPSQGLLKTHWFPPQKGRKINKNLISGGGYVWGGWG